MALISFSKQPNWSHHRTTSGRLSQFTPHIILHSWLPGENCSFLLIHTKLCTEDKKRDIRYILPTTTPCLYITFFTYILHLSSVIFRHTYHIMVPISSFHQPMWSHHILCLVTVCTSNHLAVLQLW